MPTSSAILEPNSFSRLLKRYRKQRGLSQLELSLSSHVSQRHISFLESGRSKPSREMVLQLATILAVPFREQNTLLTAAGFAPVFAESDLSSPELAPIRQALDFMLRQQEPYPAMVLDRYWNLIESNKAAERLLAILIDPDQRHELIADTGHLNLVKATLHPQVLRPCILNWEDIATNLIRRVHRETLTQDHNEISIRLFEELLTYPDVNNLWRTSAWEGWQMPILTVDFKKDERLFRFFSTITTLGTPYDITLQELRIESLFPADEATAQQMKQLSQLPHPDIA